MRSGDDGVIVFAVSWVLRRILGADVNDVLRIAHEFHQITLSQRHVIARQQAEIMRLKLEYSRWGRDIVSQFLVAQQAGTDLRDALTLALRDLDDEVARLEEHAPA